MQYHMEMRGGKATVCARVSREHCQPDTFIMVQRDPRQASHLQTCKIIRLLLSLR